MARIIHGYIAHWDNVLMPRAALSRPDIALLYPIVDMAPGRPEYSHLIHRSLCPIRLTGCVCRVFDHPRLRGSLATPRIDAMTEDFKAQGLSLIAIPRICPAIEASQLFSMNIGSDR